jgi:Trp operon repressor
MQKENKQQEQKQVRTRMSIIEELLKKEKKNSEEKQGVNG